VKLIYYEACIDQEDATRITSRSAAVIMRFLIVKGNMTIILQKEYLDASKKFIPSIRRLFHWDEEK
jgi:hypothetical protein